MSNLLYAKIVSSAVKALSDAANTVRINVQSVFGDGNILSEIGIIAPYGVGSVPPKNINTIVTTVNGSSKKLYSIGVVDGVPKIKTTPIQGESWLRSLKYMLLVMNGAVKVFRINDEEFDPTLNNGEAFVQTMINRINEMQTQITYLSTLVNQLQSHTHPSNGAAPSQTFTTPTTPSALAKDKTYLTSGKGLINDLGEMYT